MVQPSNLDDPAIASIAWRRYWRLMRGMAAVVALLTCFCLAILYWRHPQASIHLYIATAGAMIFSAMLCAALMGLVFLSSGTGHDDAIENPLENEGVQP